MIPIYVTLESKNMLHGSDVHKPQQLNPPSLLHITSIDRVGAKVGAKDGGGGPGLTPSRTNVPLQLKSEKQPSWKTTVWPALIVKVTVDPSPHDKSSSFFATSWPFIKARK